MIEISDKELTGNRLVRLGVLLLMIGLITGFVVPLVAIPRMGLASHIQGILNGMLLMILGVIWPKLQLSPRISLITFCLSVYAAFANWLATLLSAIWGAGRSMPIAAAGRTGPAWQEFVVDFLLFSLSLAMIAVTVLLLFGLRRRTVQDSPKS